MSQLRSSPRLRAKRGRSPEPFKDRGSDNLQKKVKFDAEEHLSSYNLNLVAIALEIFGSLLFLTGSKHGARLLLIHMMAVTPIMHNFYAVMPGTHTTHA